MNISLAQVPNKMATSSTTNTEHVGGNPPVIIVTDELEDEDDQLEHPQHFPYDSSATSELEDEASANTRVSQTQTNLYF